MSPPTIGRARPAVAAALAVLCATSAARADEGNAPPLEGVAPPRGAIARALARRFAARAFHARRDLRPRPALALLTPPSPLAGNSVELASLDGKLSFDTSAGTVTSTSTIVVKSLSSTLFEVYLYLGEKPPISGISVSDSNGPLQVQDVGSDVVMVTLAQPLAAGSSVSLTVTQSGQPSCKSSFLSLETCRVSSSMIYSVSSGWQPSLYDIQTYSLVEATSGKVAITTPAGFVAGSTGVLSSQTTNSDGTITYTFTNQAPGAFSFGASTYGVGSSSFTASSGTKKAGTYFLSSATSADYLQAEGDIITFHEARYGEYLPTKIDVIEVPDAAGAAYGPYMAVFMPSSLVADAPTDWYSSMTLAHELGHQWFGGMIALVDSYSPWINEGMATFAEMDYSEVLATKSYGTDYGPAIRLANTLAYLYEVSSTEDVPITSAEIYNVSSSAYVVLTYDKGGMVVSMLRYYVGGDTPFFAAMKSYKSDHASAGATAKSLRTSIEKATGLALADFFQSWVYGTGYPTYSVKVTRSSSGGKYVADIEVTADQDFGMPVELGVLTADGNTETTRVEPTSGSTTMTYKAESSSEILKVSFDPERQLVCRQKGALAGDLYMNGEVDGIDLIYAAMAQGQGFDSSTYYYQGFADWADLSFDGKIDSNDLDVVVASFGKKTGE